MPPLLCQLWGLRQFPAQFPYLLGWESPRKGVRDIHLFVNVCGVHLTNIYQALINYRVLFLVVQKQREIKQKVKVSESFSLSKNDSWTIPEMFSTLICEQETTGAEI